MERGRNEACPNGLSEFPDAVRTILNRPRSGSGGGIPLTRGEVAMTFLDGHAGDDNNSLNIRSQGFSDGTDWNALTTLDILENPDTAFVWSKWEPLELWYQKEHSSGYRE